MKSLFHPIAILSIVVAGALAPVAVSTINATPVRPSPFFGRWTVNEDKPVFTAKGRLYKTIDIARCGKDFCGVSVADNGKCGPVLFRFLTKHAYDQSLHGHSAWGTGKKNIQLETWEAAEWPGGRELEIYVGDGYDFGGRSDSMPKFHGEYKRTGDARCKAQ